MTPNLFAENLVRLRELAGLTQQQLAKRSNTGHSSVNRWEKGKSTPKRGNVESLDKALGANGDLMSVWLAVTTGNGLPEWARDIEGIERAARRVTIATPALVPGMLQCPEYAHAVFTAGQPDTDAEEIARLVALRCGRLKELAELQVTAVFPLGAVSYMSPKVRSAQAAALLSWHETGRVKVQVIPEGTLVLVPAAPLMDYRLRSGESAIVSDHADGNLVYDLQSGDRLAGQITAALAAALPEPLSIEALRSLV
ncbi:Scr1 family TA system antitoxin-like transcriptional regulator [Nocardiopsis sp. LDBS1602]|uniref:Scr1 family TA system antitoxin-like transcriptional regulator n=1 Tax=Nocardiopsis sp. LDBS1602 TaxID=3109597 RepID=UPI002DB61439|nr:Scr1 family TA system antitoxin-like transcriptional regulator [Nocardiopsis sp. LDBS1602]MEC3891053.1 Scr1 family TA system antitoxin-like transcriptional regulator [Nocardiopsis sp. LDBS1602]